jgi:hypothetical protein
MVFQKRYQKWSHGKAGTPPPAPVNLTAPTILGIGQVGQTLTATNGTWTNSPTSYAYQWYRAGVAIGGQTASTYSSVSADINQTVTATVVATNSHGSSTAIVNSNPAYGIYSSTLGAATPTLLYSLPSTQINHAFQSPSSSTVGFTVYGNGTEAGGANNTSIQLLTSGVVTTAVAASTTHQNSWMNWLLDGSGFYYITTQGTSPANQQAIGKYVIAGSVISIYYNPSDINITSCGVNSGGNVVLAGTTPVTGGAVSYLYVWNGTTRTQLTTAPVFLSGSVLGDFAPSWNGTTQVATLRQVSPGLYYIVVITVGGGFSNTGETIIVPPGSNQAFFGIPQWSSDGAKILCWVVDPVEPGVTGLYSMNPDGTGMTQIVINAESQNTEPSFVPAGGSSSSAGIVYSTQSQGMFPAQPTISGTAQVGQILTASGGTGSYQWDREGAPIAGATSSTYTLVNADQGALITVQSSGLSSVLAGPVLGGTVYYVSSSGGNDSNNGTSSGTPWKTLTKVNGTAFTAGTSVLFKRGDTWRLDGCSTSSGTQLSPSASGSATQPIVFDAYGAGANPIFDGSYDLSTTGAWQASGTTNVWQSVHQFNGFGHPNGKPNNAADDPGNLIWGITPVGGNNVPAALVNASYGIMTGSGTGGVWYTPGDGTANIGTTQGNWNFNTDNNRIQIYCVGNPASTLGSSDLRAAIDTCLVYFNSQSNIIIQNITFNYSGATVMDTGGSGGACTNITLRDCVMQWGGGGNISGSSDLDSRYGDAWDMEGSISGALMERVWFHQIFDTTAGPQCNSPHQDNIVIRNNVCTSCGAFFSTFFLGGIPTASGLYVYNNTVYVTTNAWPNNPTQRPNGAENVFGLNVGTVTTTVVQTNMAINNNIFDSISGISPSPGFGIIATDWNVGGGVNNTNPFTAGGLSGAAWLDYNLWPNNSLSPVGAPAQDIALHTGNFRMVDWVKGVNSPAGAGTFTPALEVHGIFGTDPQFISQTAYNFTLQASAARSSGKIPATMPVPSGAASGLVWDFNHNPRPTSGSISMGAFQ